jgi:hypothetical protein
MPNDGTNRPAFAGSVGPLENDQHARPGSIGTHQPAKVQSQLNQPALPLLQALGVLLTIEPLGHV